LLIFQKNNQTCHYFFCLEALQERVQIIESVAHFIIDFFSLFKAMQSIFLIDTIHGFNQSIFQLLEGKINEL
jgi:hypothetical protein